MNLEADSSTLPRFGKLFLSVFRFPIDLVNLVTSYKLHSSLLNSATPPPRSAIMGCMYGDGASGYVSVTRKVAWRSPARDPLLVTAKTKAIKD